MAIYFHQFIIECQTPLTLPKLVIIFLTILDDRNGFDYPIPFSSPIKFLIPNFLITIIDIDHLRFRFIVKTFSINFTAFFLI